MSRVGKHPIKIPSGVTVSLKDGVLSGKGKNGEFEFKVREGVKAEIANDEVVFKPCDDSKTARSMWGTCRAIVSKAIAGLSTYFVKKVNLVGVGYKASVQGKNLVMQLGYSRDVTVEIPSDVKVACETPTAILVSGADSQRVGEFAKSLQRFRTPSPFIYSGNKKKGIFIDGEKCRNLREGKKK
ncbi:MAG: 50S ribosomal protein L6 [Holosporaceae bacterium]|jgi:large subunit ribosomal protein L6|nr:50S ribosomal protein L6 [Holosporaceae bacterium]